MLNNEEPINLMFRTSLQLLTMSSYDSICRGGQMVQYLIESIVFSADWIKSVNQSLNNYKHSMILYVQPCASSRLIHGHRS